MDTQKQLLEELLKSPLAFTNKPHLIDEIMKIFALSNKELEAKEAELDQVNAEVIQKKIDDAQAVIDELQPKLEQLNNKLSVKTSTL